MMSSTVIKKGFAVFLSKAVTGYDCDLHETVYAKSAAAAKYQAFRQWEFENIKIMLAMQSRRSKYMDLLKNTPHELAGQLTEKQLDKMRHALGYRVDLPAPEEPFRNRYVVNHDEDLEPLIPAGLIVKGNRLDMNVYFVTDLGIKVINSLQPITRWQLEVAA